MFRRPVKHDTINSSQLTFDFVTGVMRGDERKYFARRLERDASLQAQVQYWENVLMDMCDAEQSLPPAAATWNKIASQLGGEATKSRVARSGLWQAITMMACCAILVVGWFVQDHWRAQAPNADYVAVLTNEADAPQLTVLTASDGKKMWLKWNLTGMPERKNLQLWAQSKRDAQMRPIALFAELGQPEQPLTLAQWRLIKDASHLLLTEEEEGGSPLGEPSAAVVARGVCVLLVAKDQEA
jgi:anti-sigma-K factor RskA